jgi:gliding motility-associated-like protein
MHVIKPDAPKISGLQTRYCVGDTISLKVDLVQGATYSWTGPAGFSASTAEIKIPVDGVGKAGVYVVNVSLNGCTSDPASVNIASIGQTPTAAFRSEPKPPAKLSFPVRIRFFNESIDADAFFWNFGDGNTSTDRDPEHTYRTDGNFDVSLTVFKSSVCSASTTQGQFIISANNILFIPNTFTPNNDALNDEFVISMTNIKTYKIQIFNRFGVLLFVSEDLFNHWNGNFNNKPSPLGTYYYLIEAFDFNGNIIKKTGSVTILR